MPDMQSARHGVADAKTKADGLFAEHNTQNVNEAQYEPCGDKRTRCLAGPRFEHLVERVHSLGPRPLAELLAEIATVTGEPGLIADRIEAYARLDPEIIRAVGADKFPPTVVEVVR